MAEKNYAAALFPYLEKPRPIEKSQPSRRGPGRPKALGKARHPGQFLKAIAEINLENQTYCTDSSIAGMLSQLPEYKHLSVDVLRHDVAKAINPLIGLFKKCPPDLWEEIFEIEPPGSMTRKELRQKAFEFLRRQLLPKKR